MGADWYVDPLGRFDGRFFDGVQWTGQVSVDGHLRSDPDWPLAVASVAAVPEQPAMWLGTKQIMGGERRNAERRETNAEAGVERRHGERRQMRVIVTDVDSVGESRPWRTSN